MSTQTSPSGNGSEPCWGSSVIHAGGSMAKAVAEADWARTPLGALETWTPLLRSYVNLVLSSHQPAFLVWGNDFTLVYNDGVVPTLGDKHPAALGRSYRDVFSEAWPQIKPELEGCFYRGETPTYENTLVPIALREGKTESRYFTYSLLPVYEEDRIVGVYSTYQDTTKAVVAAQQLRSSETRSDRILQSIGDGVIVTDAAMRVVLINEVAQRLCGWSQEDAEGRALPEIFRIVQEETREIVVSPAEKVVQSGAVVGLANHTILIGKDGHETHIDDSAAPVRDDQGGLAGIVLVFRDIGERRAAEKQRDAIGAELSQVLDVTKDAVLSMDREWRITYMNPNARKAAAPLGEIGRNFWECFPDAVYDGSPYVENYERAMYRAHAADFEAFYPAPLEIWVDISVRPTDKGITLFFRDITEAKQMSASLVLTEKLAAVGRLAASIAHEINNPLEAVTNLLYLARGTNDVDEVHGYLDTAERELRRVSIISSQTLRFHKQSTAPQQVTCTDLFETTLSIHHGRILNSHILVEKRKRAERPVSCFEGEIRQVLNNLIGNAIDAMPQQGGRLLLRSRESCDWRTGKKGVALTVADTGTGMPPAVLRKIFEAFYTTKGIGGTGLGLWVSKEIVERHHGTLLVRSSQKEGHSGTVFSLFLPYDAVSR